MPFDISDIDLNLLPDDADGWVNVVARILQESVTANTGQRSQLITLITQVVKKTGLSLSDLDTVAQHLQVNLALTNLSQRLSEMSARNIELRALATRLGVEVRAANADAGKLTTITREIQKATASISTIKEMVTQLHSTDVTLPAKIQAVLTALETLTGAL